MMQSSIYGRIGADPRPLETKSGKPMASASIAVDATPHNAENPETLWLKILCFGKVAESLLRHEKGDIVALSGKIQQTRWTNGNGEEKVDLQVIADSLISAKTVRPPGKKKASPATDTQAEEIKATNEFYDELTF